jgi:hypothetical protein
MFVSRENRKGNTFIKKAQDRLQTEMAALKMTSALIRLNATAT